MKPPVVKWRPTGPVLAGHVAEARRRLRDRASEIHDDALARALWIARALPIALDVLADSRATPGLSAARLSSAEVYVRAETRGRLLAFGLLLNGGEELHVRFVCERGACVESVALVLWRLSAKVADDDGPPVIHRFAHGPGDRPRR